MPRQFATSGRDPFGYSVELLSSRLSEGGMSEQNKVFFESLQRDDDEELGLINAVGDNNCGPRAIIQSLLIRGITTPSLRGAVREFLQGIYDKQNDTLDAHYRGLYGCVLRRKSQKPRKKGNPHPNSCVLVGDTLYYIDFSGTSTQLEIVDQSAFETQIKKNGNFWTLDELSLDADTSTVRITYTELNDFTGSKPFIDYSDSIKTSIHHFLSVYENYSPSYLTDLRDSFFGQEDPEQRAVFDHVIYALAGCLRFDIRDYVEMRGYDGQPSDRLLGGKLSAEETPLKEWKAVSVGGIEGEMTTKAQALSLLGTLQQDMDLLDCVGYFADHGIYVSVCGSSVKAQPLGQLIDSEEIKERLSYSERFAAPTRPQPLIDIEIYRSGEHFMSLVRESRDSIVSIPQAANDEKPKKGSTTSEGDAKPSVSFTGKSELYIQLRIIRAKSSQLNDKKAVDAAYDLYIKIKAHADDFFVLNKSSEYEFKSRCAAEIAKARLVLDRFGWKDILRNLALAIMGVGIIYVGACLINKAVTGHFLFFRPDMAKRVDILEEKLTNVSVSEMP